MGRTSGAVALALLAACGTRGDADVGDHHEHGDVQLGRASAALSDADPVSAAVAESCTTSVVRGLSTQLVDEIQCMRPGTFASLDGAPGFSLGGAVFPWLQAPARDALLAAQKERGVTMTINSALRTLPQQYLLYRWYRSGRCGIALAASPGKSNHESGLAVDIDDNAAWRGAMRAHELEWLGASDPVHFDYEGEGRADVAGLSVLAFQRLWNRNHPEDTIDEDGSYGPATEERLAKAPVGGFAEGAACGSPTTDAPAPPASGGGRGGPLGASGERRDGEGPGGCAVGPARGAPARDLGGGALALLGLAALGRRRGGDQGSARLRRKSATSAKRRRR